MRADLSPLLGLSRRHLHLFSSSSSSSRRGPALALGHRRRLPAAATLQSASGTTSSARSPRRGP